MDELRTRAWIEGRNIQFDVRWTTDNMDRIRSNATDVMQAKPDVVLAIGGRVVPVLMRLSKKIPIVVPGGPDPVGVGWVQSIARPGGNVTGFTFLECLDRPSGGRYFFEGVEIAALEEPERARLRSERLGFVFQSFNLLARTSALAFDWASHRLARHYCAALPRDRASQV